MQALPDREAMCHTLNSEEPDWCQGPMPTHSELCSMGRGLGIFKMLQMIAIVSQRWESLYIQMLLRGNAKVKVSVIQSCPTLWGPMDCSPPGPTIHGILQARVLEWAAISFSREPSQLRDPTPVSHIADSLPSEPPGKPQWVLGLW